MKYHLPCLVTVLVVALEDDDEVLLALGRGLFGSYRRSSTSASVGSVKKIVKSPEFEPPVSMLSVCSPV